MEKTERAETENKEWKREKLQKEERVIKNKRYNKIFWT